MRERTLSFRRLNRGGALAALACAAALLLAGPPLAAKESAATKCHEAIDRFDAAHGDEHDDPALQAARALAALCSEPGKDHARAVSRLGMVQYAQHDLAGATESFRAASDALPGDPTMRLSLCGVYTEARRFEEAIDTCSKGLELARALDDGSSGRHDSVLKLGFNLALAKVRRGGVCGDHSVYELFDAYRVAHPDHAWVHQLLGAWVWDCENDFDRGLALYKKSCDLGQQAACEQVEYTESCRCKTLKDASH